MKAFLKKAIERVTRGMAYWIAYKCETSAVKFTEAEAVGEMINILRSVLPSCTIRREVEYKSVCPSINSSKRADIGVFIDDKCQSLLEVKLSENTNGGYKADIKKLNELKRIDDTIDCYVILLYRNSCKIKDPKNFVSTDGKALKQTIDAFNCKMRVRRVSNALCSKNADKMKKVVCFEVL
jgi:hypothetical protein